MSLIDYIHLYENLNQEAEIEIPTARSSEEDDDSNDGVSPEPSNSQDDLADQQQQQHQQRQQTSNNQKSQNDNSDKDDDEEEDDNSPPEYENVEKYIIYRKLRQLHYSIKMSDLEGDRYHDALMFLEIILSFFETFTYNQLITLTNSIIEKISKLKEKNTNNEALKNETE